MDKTEAYDKMNKMACGFSAAGLIIGLGILAAGCYHDIRMMILAGMIFVFFSTSSLLTGITKLRKKK